MLIKKGGKVGIGIVILIAVGFGLYKYSTRPKTVGDLKVAGKVVIPDAPNASLKGNAAVKLDLPGTKLSNKGDLVDIDWWMMAWQSQNSIILANGGAQTTENSLLESVSLNVKITRQDNCMQSCNEMVKYLKDYKEGKTKKGFFITFMGTGIPNYFNSIYEATKDLGPEFQPVVFLSTGKSYGEDQIIGPKEILDNKQLLRGKVLRGIKLDGDIDLGLKLANDNNIPINADASLYYPDALNLSYATGDGTYLTIVNDYNNNIKEKRRIVRNGKTVGDTLVGIDMVATWTPGDVNAKNGRGGVTIISTRDYSSIMPNITIASKKFLNDNRSKIENMIGALATAGDQIRSYEDIKKYSCKLGAEVWNENDEAYWYKYFNGEQVDKDTHLGGSAVFNLKDMAFLFGLDGSRDTYKDIYNTFGKLQSFYYPEDLPKFVEYSIAVDKSYMASVISNHPELMEGQALKTDYSKSTGEVVGSKSVTIEFELGSSTIKNESYAVLDEVAQSVSTSEGLNVVIEGHTDNTGNVQSNIKLSEDRAASVLSYLIAKKIDKERLRSKGFGSNKPIADNSTASGRQKNRRVQIVLTK